jgi:hypothetical protein
MAIVANAHSTCRSSHHSPGVLRGHSHSEKLIVREDSEDSKDRNQRTRKPPKSHSNQASRHNRRGPLPNRLVAAGVRLAGHQHGRSFFLRPVPENVENGIHGPAGCQHTQPYRSHNCGKQYESCYQRVQGSARLTRFKYSVCRYLQPLPTASRQLSNLPALTLAAVDR